VVKNDFNEDLTDYRTDFIANGVSSSNKNLQKYNTSVKNIRRSDSLEEIAPSIIHVAKKPSLLEVQEPPSTRK
jgi:hypothetical protein